MSNAKILYICSEITPYLPDSEIATLSRQLPQVMQEMGSEIRLFMPKYGCVNERRNQLHEVIRLSGMNIIIDDTDHQLIIKVASIPSARVQVYFIDNEDFFHRKATVKAENGVMFADNDERAMFFARGVLETVKKLRWAPNMVHVHGWLSAVAPVYLRNTYKDDPIFSKLRIVVSLYDDSFEGEMDKEFKNKIALDGVKSEKLNILGDAPDYQSLMRFAISHADGVIAGSAGVCRSLLDYAREQGVPVLEYQGPDHYAQAYADFYQSILNE